MFYAIWGRKMKLLFWKILLFLSVVMIIVSLYCGKNESFLYFVATLVQSLLFIRKQ